MEAEISSETFTSNKVDCFSYTAITLLINNKHLVFKMLIVTSFEMPNAAVASPTDVSAAGGWISSGDAVGGALPW
jgi:hypothetical protein